MSIARRIVFLSPGVTLAASAQRGTEPFNAALQKPLQDCDRNIPKIHPILLSVNLELSDEGASTLL